MFPNIEAERARRNLTQQQLADTLNVSLKTLQNWLNGKTSIPSSYLIKLATMWNTSIDYLLNMEH